VTDMKKREAANEKLMYEIAQENKRLTEPLAKALKEVEQLRLGLTNYEKVIITWIMNLIVELSFIFFFPDVLFKRDFPI
jgi:hypothetical protein